MATVASTAIREITYNEETRQLNVLFVRGKGGSGPFGSYVWPDITPEQHEDFLAAGSKGTWLNANLPIDR